MARFLFLSHLDFNLFRFRLPVMKALVEKGHVVVAASPPGAFSHLFAAYGVKHEPYEIDRRAVGPMSEAATVLGLRALLRRVRPGLMHTFMHKPNIYGSLAARGIPDLKIVSSVTGLGSAYTGSHRSLRLIMNGLYRLAMRRSAVVIFQNPDDRRYFISRRLVEPERTVIISGSGVDTVAFRPVERSGRPVVTVCMVARLVRTKGVEEYVEAARRVRQALGESIRFCLIGGPDPGNPGSMTAEWLEGVRTTGDVEILGERDDIGEILAQSDIYCLPSHGEGMPMSILEALASGLPVVTTEVPGCRETVEDGVNGFLVPVRNVPRLADALQRLATDSGLRASFGSASRRAAESRFAVGDIVKAHVELYERVLAG